MTDKQSFLNIKKWESKIEKNGQSLNQSCVYLIGNKNDLKPKVYNKIFFLEKY